MLCNADCSWRSRSDCGGHRGGRITGAEAVCLFFFFFFFFVSSPLSLSLVASMLSFYYFVNTSSFSSPIHLSDQMG